jgi:hypothetical protein
MDDTQSYMIDILNLVPDAAQCYIQAPNSDSEKLLQLTKNSPFDWFRQVQLSPSNKKLLCDLIKIENIQADFQSIEIRLKDQLLFEGYDGMEYGTISKSLILPKHFIEFYINKQMCIISSQW